MEISTRSIKAATTEVLTLSSHLLRNSSPSQIYVLTLNVSIIRLHIRTSETSEYGQGNTSVKGTTLHTPYPPSLLSLELVCVNILPRYTTLQVSVCLQTDSSTEGLILPASRTRDL
jgi:hypothetical protein